VSACKKEEGERVRGGRKEEQGARRNKEEGRRKDH